MKQTRTAFTLLSLCLLVATPALAQDKGKKPTPPPKKPGTSATKPAEKKPAEAAHKTGVGSEVDGSISLADLTGKTHALKDYRGKVVVIDFWSMDPVSAGYDRRLAQLAEDYSKKGVVFLAIDPSQGDSDGDGLDGTKRIQEYAQKNHLTFPILIDKGGAVAQRLGAKTTPEVLVLDTKGIVRYSGAIDDDPKAEKADKAIPYLRNALEAVMAGKELGTPTTTPAGTPIKHEKSEKAPEPPAKKN